MLESKYNLLVVVLKISHYIHQRPQTHQIFKIVKKIFQKSQNFLIS